MPRVGQDKTLGTLERITGRDEHCLRSDARTVRQVSTAIFLLTVTVGVMGPVSFQVAGGFTAASGYNAGFVFRRPFTALCEGSVRDQSRTSFSSPPSYRGKSQRPVLCQEKCRRFFIKRTPASRFAFNAIAHSFFDAKLVELRLQFSSSHRRKLMKNRPLAHLP